MERKLSSLLLGQSPAIPHILAFSEAGVWLEERKKEDRRGWSPENEWGERGPRTQTGRQDPLPGCIFLNVYMHLSIRVTL